MNRAAKHSWFWALTQAVPRALKPLSKNLGCKCRHSLSETLQRFKQTLWASPPVPCFIWFHFLSLLEPGTISTPLTLSTFSHPTLTYLPLMILQDPCDSTQPFGSGFKNEVSRAMSSQGLTSYWHPLHPSRSLPTLSSVVCALDWVQRRLMRFWILARVKGLAFCLNLVFLICFPVASLQVVIRLSVTLVTLRIICDNSVWPVGPGHISRIKHWLPFSGKLYFSIFGPVCF